MADWPLHGGARVLTAGVNAAASRGITITAAATANVKGAWTELISAVNNTVDAQTIYINIRSSSVANVDYLVDIGVGEAGAEQVVVANVQASASVGGTIFFGGGVWIPLVIPRGVRVAARCQCTTLSATCRVQVGLQAGGWLLSPGPGRVSTYGANTADSGGVSVDPGATINTKGAWSQIVASATNPLRALVACIGNQLNGVRIAGDYLVDIGVGGAGSEQIIIPDLHVEDSSNSDTIVPSVLGPFAVDIPATTRLAARAQCSHADATDRLFDITLYGVD